MVDYKEIELAFKRTELFNKAEIIQSLDLTIDFIEINENGRYSNATQTERLVLCRKFKDSLTKCNLPTLTEPFCCYRYSFTGDSLILTLCNCSDIELEDNEKSISSSVDSEKVLLYVKCEYLTIEQFALKQNVTPGTVNKWVERGKLRHIKKDGDKWLISAIMDRPNQEYVDVQYIWEELPVTVFEEYPILSMCKYLTIFRDHDKSIFKCKPGDVESEMMLDFNMSRKEIERLEFVLITSGTVEIHEIIAQFVPNIDRKN